MSVLTITIRWPRCLQIARSVSVWVLGLTALVGSECVGQESAAVPSPQAPPADVTGFVTDQQVLQAEAARVEVVRELSRAVLAIFPNTAADNGGSGVLISADGYALTNFHVAQPCGAAMKCGLNDGVLYDAVRVGLDPTGDVALIKLVGRDDFPYARLGDSSQTQAGDECFVAGNPFLLAMDFQPTITFGVISGTGRYQYPAGTLLEYGDCLQTDASINPGNSGGPLFNAKGELIGINGRGSFEKRGRVNVGVGYAISINQIKNFLGDLKSGRIVDHAQLNLRAINDSRGRANVADILENSDAFRRGLRHEDVITELAGRPIRSSNELTNVIATLPPGWRVPLKFLREGVPQEIYVRLDNLHRDGELTEQSENPIAPPSPKEPKEPKQERPAEGELPEGNTPGEEGPANPDAPNVPTPHEDAEEAPGDSEPEHGDETEPGPKEQKSGGVPPALAPLYAARTGFANYHFNRLAQDRLNGLRSAWNAPRTAEEVRLQWQGKAKLRGRFSLEVTEQSGRFRLDSGEALALFSSDEVPQLEPPKSGGLLPAVALWRIFVVHGTEGFEQAVYQGTAPLLGQAEPCDVLVVKQGLLEARLYFATDTGYLVCLEMYPEPKVDPCELWFTYHTVEGRLQPRDVLVLWGNSAYDTLTIDQQTWSAVDAPAGAGALEGPALSPEALTVPAASEAEDGPPAKSTEPSANPPRADEGSSLLPQTSRLVALAQLTSRRTSGQIVQGHCS